MDLREQISTACEAQDRLLAEHRRSEAERSSDASPYASENGPDGIL
jgi:hypothetical protein